jgi:hypothetical protein
VSPVFAGREAGLTPLAGALRLQSGGGSKIRPSSWMLPRAM